MDFKVHKKKFSTLSFYNKTPSGNVTGTEEFLSRACPETLDGYERHVPGYAGNGSEHLKYV